MSKHVTTMTIYDAEHYSDEEREMIVDGYAEHERDARAKGIPTMGSGAIFPVPEKDIVCEPFPIPLFWRRIAGIDFGWDHPTGVTWLAYDADSDIVYVTDTYKARRTLMPIIASAIKSRGKWIPCAWPHDGHQVKDAKHGQQIAKQYRDEGVNMLREHAQFKKDKKNEAQGSVVSVEAGLQEMLTRMQTGRWKVFNTQELWLEEFRMYHREDGVVVKLYDDVISSSRYAYMMLRKAQELPMDKPRQLQAGWQPSDAGMGY